MNRLPGATENEQAFRRLIELLLAVDRVATSPTPPTDYDLWRLRQEANIAHRGGDVWDD